MRVIKCSYCGKIRHLKNVSQWTIRKDNFCNRVCYRASKNWRKYAVDLRNHVPRLNQLLISAKK